MSWLTPPPLYPKPAHPVHRMVPPTMRPDRAWIVTAATMVFCGVLGVGIAVVISILAGGLERFGVRGWMIVVFVGASSGALYGFSAATRAIAMLTQMYGQSSDTKKNV